MKPDSIVYCKICGKKKAFEGHCCDRSEYLPRKLQKKLGFIIEDDYALNYIYQNNRFCVWCGEKVIWLDGGFVKECNCGKDVTGGKFFRLSESLSFCENCGEEVKSRNIECYCGYFPIITDNDYDLGKLEINYCKDCGKKMSELTDFKQDVVNEITGEVTTEYPHVCNMSSPYYD
jgi:hypothetical protein